MLSRQKQSAMAVRGLSVITGKVAASLPNRSGAKVRLSSGESRYKPLSMMCRKNCVERAKRTNAIFSVYVLSAFGFSLP